MKNANNRAPLQPLDGKLCTALQADCKKRCTVYTRLSYCDEHYAERSQTVATYKHASERADSLEPRIEEYARDARNRAFGTIEAVRKAIQDVEEYLRELTTEYEGRVVHSQRFYVNGLDRGHRIRMDVIQNRKHTTTDLLAQLLQYQCDLTAAEPQIVEKVCGPAKRSKKASSRAASYVVGLPAIHFGAVFIGLDDEDMEGYEGADWSSRYVLGVEDEHDNAEPQDEEEVEGESDEENESVYGSEDSDSGEETDDDDDDDDMMDDSLAGTFAGLLYWSLLRRGTYKQSEVAVVASKVVEEMLFLPPQYWASEAYRIVKSMFGHLEGPVSRYLINTHKSLSSLALTPRNGFHVTWDNVYLQSNTH